MYRGWACGALGYVASDGGRERKRLYASVASRDVVLAAIAVAAMLGDDGVSRRLPRRFGTACDDAAVEG